MKKLIPIVLILFIIASLNIPAFAYGVNSGDFGSVHWSMTETTLTITGTGPITKPSDGWPWYESDYSYRDIKTVIVGEGITSLPDEIFLHFDSMTSVSLPSTLKSIGISAFERSGLTSIVIPEGVTDIGRLAFYDCEDLTDVSVPSTLVNAGDSIFANSGLTNITIAEGTTTLGEMPFDGCDKLTSIYIPGSFGPIDRDLFYRCDNLQSVTLGEGIKRIEENAFSSKRSLSHVSLPSTLKHIGSGAFSCTALTEANLSDNITSLGYGVFDGCESLVSASIPASVAAADLGDNIFSDCTALKSVTIKSPTASLRGIIKGCTALETVSLPNTLTSVDASLFETMPDLRRVDVAAGGESVFSDDGVVYEKVGARQYMVCYPASREGDTYALADGTTAFKGTLKDRKNLKKLILPDSMTELKSDGTYPMGFSANTITELVLPDTMTSLNSLQGFTALETLDVPAGVTVVRTSAFADCESLKEITFSDKLAYLYSAADAELPALETVTFAMRPPQTNGIASLFPGGKSVTVRYPSNLAALWTGTEWEDAYTLVPYEVSGIIDEGDWGGDAESGKLHWIVYASGELSISGTGAMKDASPYGTLAPWYKWRDVITSVVVKDGVTSLGENAFYGLVGVVSAELPEGLTLISKDAFEGCTSIEEINLPASVNQILATADKSPGAVYTVDEMSYAHMYALDCALNFKLSGRRAEVTVVYIRPAGAGRSDTQVEAEIRAAIAPNRRVILADGIYMLNSTLEINSIYDFSLEAENPGGAELVLKNGYAPVISVSRDLRYSDSLSCRFISVDGLIMGHVAAKNNQGCSGEGYVFAASNVHDLTVTRCDLWGCGVIGFALSYSDGISVSDTVVRDCMKNAVTATNTEAAFEHCVFSGNSYFNYNNKGAGQSSDQACFMLYNYGGDKPAITVRDSMIFNNYSYALIPGSSQYTQGEVFVNCAFNDNAWQGATPQNYGICLGGLTWQVTKDNTGKQTLVIGEPIELTGGGAIESENGTLPAYSTWSTPWRKLLSGIRAVRCVNSAKLSMTSLPRSVFVTYSDVPAGKYSAAIAVYDTSGRLAGFSIKEVTLGGGQSVDFDAPAALQKGSYTVFLLDGDGFAPAADTLRIDTAESAS